MVRSRFKQLQPERQRALVMASVLVLATILLIAGIVSPATWLVFPGALAIAAMAGFKIATLDGLLPSYYTWPRWAKIAYWCLWVIAWPLFLLALEAAVWIKVWDLWQSAPALTSARIAELERQLDTPAED